MWRPKGTTRPKQRVRAPVLDRLIDDEPGGPPEQPPKRTFSRAQFSRAVVRDLEWLFNTRCTTRFGVSPSEAGPRTVLDYGLDDFSHLSAASFEDRRKLARAIRDAITAFEPRLEVKRVEVEQVDGRNHVAQIYVEGVLIAGSIREAVSFRTVLGEEGDVVIGR